MLMCSTCKGEIASTQIIQRNVGSEKHMFFDDCIAELVGRIAHYKVEINALRDANDELSDKLKTQQGRHIEVMGVVERERQHRHNQFSQLQHMVSLLNHPQPATIMGTDKAQRNDSKLKHDIFCEYPAYPCDCRPSYSSKLDTTKLLALIGRIESWSPGEGFYLGTGEKAEFNNADMVAYLRSIQLKCM